MTYTLTHTHWDHFFFSDKSVDSIHFLGTLLEMSKSVTAGMCFPCTRTSNPEVFPGIGHTEERVGEHICEGNDAGKTRNPM